MFEKRKNCNNSIFGENIAPNKDWKHIKIAIDDFGHRGFQGLLDFSKVIGAGWFFNRGEVNTLYTGEHIGFANVCGTVD